MIIVSENFPFFYSIYEDVKYVHVKHNTQEYSENHADFLKDLTACFKVSENETIVKIQASEEVLEQLEKCLLHFTTIPCSPISEEATSVITELFRSLRNCATNQQVQDFISDKTNILQITRNYVQAVDKQQLCMKIILQFLINLISSNRTVAQTLHTDFFDFLVNLAQNSIYTYEFSALFYNISLVIPINHNLVEIMFKLDEASNQNEFTLFFIKNCICSLNFWNIYPSLKHSFKVVTLELLRSKQIENKQYSIPLLGLNVLIDSFLKSPDIFFKINNETAHKEVQEVSLLLGIISSLSSKDEYIIELQENKNILVTASALLLNFHRLGKNDGNVFTPIRKLSESMDNDGNNPVFGLKADLIQLIGNMCWKNTILQNLAREAEVIPVILDSSNIDTNNPFIIQWCIFAIRNLCENNQENQKLIAGLHKRGTVASSVLEEFGITLQGDGDRQLKIVPLDSLKKE